MKKLLLILFIQIYPLAVMGQAPFVYTEADRDFNGEAAIESVFSESSGAEFQRQVKQKIEELQQYIAFIADKEQPAADKDVYIKQALKLFFENGAAYYDSDEVYHSPASVQISSERTGKVSSQTVANYLQRLRVLPYTQVKITASDACKITNIHQEADGRYTCVAIFSQNFYGYRDGRIAYSDRVTKRIKVYVDSHTYYDNQVKLVNMTVSETRRMN